MNPCPECLGKGEVFCPVCGGTRKDLEIPIIAAAIAAEWAM